MCIRDSDKTQKKSWFKGLNREFKKIIWPDKMTLAKQTTAVVDVYKRQFGKKLRRDSGTMADNYKGEEGRYCCSGYAASGYVSDR